METIISAVISAFAAIIVCVIQSSKQAVRLEAQLDKWHSLTDQKIETLSERVDKHNNLIERTYELEKDVAIIKEHLDDDGK